MVDTMIVSVAQSIQTLTVHYVLTALLLFSKQYGICIGIVIKAAVCNVRRVNTSVLSIIRGFAPKLTPIRLCLLSVRICVCIA